MTCFVISKIEIFVLQNALDRSLRFVRQLLEFLCGDRDAIDDDLWDRLTQEGLDRNVKECGHYMHHYPICIRKVLSDETLISMASGNGEAYYAISFISYASPDDRAAFFAFADVLTLTTSRLFRARPHWGKYSPLDASNASRLYPKLAQFQEICNTCDPQGVFRNDWVEKALFD